MSDVVVVDYGAGNTHSVGAALRKVGRTSVVTNDATAIGESDFVVLPGVGSAKSAMEHLTTTGAAEALRARVDAGGATLGICLGLQLAMTSSEEDGGVAGLGLVDGVVVRLRGGRVPRLGWSVVAPWDAAFYFAHSYAVVADSAFAYVDDVAVALRHGSFLGVQFHPEKSGPAGLDFLDQCLSLA